ncbi:hypothetical protein SCA6_016778 [Theobroma cacao]
MQMPAMYTNTKSSLYDQLRDRNRYPPALVDYNGTEETTTDKDQTTSNLRVMNRQMISNGKTTKVFLGSPYRTGDEPDPGAGSLEDIPHGTIHNWLWSIWKTLGAKRKDYNDPDWLDSSFLFYDENANLVRVKPTPRKLAKKVATGGPGIALAAETKKKKSRSKKEKEEEEEILIIETIELERDSLVKFDVYVNDEDDLTIGPEYTELAGSFMNVPHKHKHEKRMKICLRLRLTDLLEDLGAEDDDSVVVTLVPRKGKGVVTVGGIKIEFAQD